MCQIFKVHAEAIATVIQFSLNELSSDFLDFFFKRGNFYGQTRAVSIMKLVL